MFKNVGSTWILNLLQILVLMKLTPFVIGALGAEANGLWVTIVAFTGILRLLVLGVPMASVRFLAQTIAAQDHAGTNRVLATCTAIAAGLGVLALLAGGALFGAFELGYLAGPQGAGLASEVLDGARLAFGVVVLQVAFGFVLRLPYAVFDAHHDFVARNAIMACELLLRLGLTLALLSWRAELWVLALVQVASMLFEFTACALVIRRRHPRIRLGLAGWDRARLREILGFSLFALVLNVGALIAFQIDALVIGAYLPAEEATYYDVGNKFFDPLTQFLIAIGAVVMPLATAHQVGGDPERVRGLLLQWTRVAVGLVLVVGTYLLVLGPSFLGAWIAPEYARHSGRVLQVLMVSFFFFLPVRGVALPLLMGLGKPARPAFLLLGMSALNLAISLALVRSQGILGVALGTAVPNVLFAVALVLLVARETDVSLPRFLVYVAARPLAGIALPAAFLMLANAAFGLQSFTAHVVIGVLFVALAAGMWIGFVHRGDPYLDTEPLIARWTRPGPRSSAR